jgi:hypothetical protein
MKHLIALFLSVVNLNAQVIPVIATNGMALLTASATTDFPSLTTTVQTNWISGQPYTNRLSHEIEVSCSVTNSMAAVVGFAGMELWLGYSTNSSTVVGIGSTTTKTLLTGLATTQEMHIRGRVPVGGFFVFTNISTGIGNSVAMRNNSGQYTILP